MVDHCNKAVYIKNNLFDEEIHKRIWLKVFGPMCNLFPFGFFLPVFGIVFTLECAIGRIMPFATYEQTS